MTKVVDALEKTWQTRLLEENPKLPQKERESIIKWLLGEDIERWEILSPEKTAMAKQGLDYRYRILQQRYLKASPTRAYQSLLNRLGSLVVLRNKIKTWVSLSRDRQRAVADVLQEVIQEMLNSDRYIQSQIIWIRQCSDDQRLRNCLLFTAIEEYCLRPIRNQPLLVYRFVNYLRRSQRGGMTQVPQQQLIRMISEEVTTDEAESTFSLLDYQAVEAYQVEQKWEEQQGLRLKVQGQFEAHLQEKVGDEAVQWLRLYLQGQTQEAIADMMNLPIKQIYRLREKVGYHAIKVFAIKGNPDLVENWLEISIKEHNMGLTLAQWETFSQGLNGDQRYILEQFKADQPVEAIAAALGWKKSQVMNEWTQLYLVAQSLRSS